MMLEIKGLEVEYNTSDGVFHAVNGVDLSVDRGEILGLVGETGAGKTTTALSILRLLPDPPGKMRKGTIKFNGENLTEKSEREMRAIRGGKISMVFQDPMTALNPVIRVGEQIAEVIYSKNKISKAEAEKKALEMLELVGIPAERGTDYPNEFSGGMRQRVVIAIALACEPDLIIADEPTTALDVTIQAQVLDLIKHLKDERNTAMILITHDLGVVAETCDRVAIMYAGEIVECGTLADIFESAAHPYTVGLFQSIPSLEEDVDMLQPIPGLMPDPTRLPQGCKFHPRCPSATEQCTHQQPALTSLSHGHFVRCLLYTETERGSDL